MRKAYVNMKHFLGLKMRIVSVNMKHFLHYKMRIVYLNMHFLKFKNEDSFCEYEAFFVLKNKDSLCEVFLARSSHPTCDISPVRRAIVDCSEEVGIEMYAKAAQ